MKNNILETSDLVYNTDNEIFNEIFRNDHVLIEQILSFGQTTPKDEWLFSDINEWVLVVQGEACLVFDDETTYVLKVGDHLIIPKRQKHRVTYTSTSPNCIWLAVHFK